MCDDLGGRDPPSKPRVSRDASGNQGMRTGVVVGLPGSFCYHLEKISFTTKLLVAVMFVAAAWVIVSFINSWTLLSTIGPRSVDNSALFSSLPSNAKNSGGDERSGRSSSPVPRENPLHPP